MVAGRLLLLAGDVVAALLLLFCDHQVQGGAKVISDFCVALAGLVAGSLGAVAGAVVVMLPEELPGGAGAELPGADRGLRTGAAAEGVMR